MKTSLVFLALLISLSSLPAAEPAEAVTFAFEVVQVRPEGIFGRVTKSINWSSSAAKLPQDDQLVFITDHPQAGEVAEGDIIAGKMTRDGFVEIDSRKLHRYRCISDFTDRKYF